MKYSTRKDFLKTTSGLLAIAFTGVNFDFKKRTPLLSFSTLGCPDWSFQQIVDFAVKNNYDGIEIRGIQRQLDLTKCPEFNSVENIAKTKKLVEENGLRFVDLGSSAELHHDGATERQKNLDDAKRFIDLSQQLNCPYIRVFPNKLPKEKDRKATIDLIIKGLIELGNYAKEKNVIVLMETHGDVVKTEDIKTIMETTSHSHIGLVWDIVNMWSVTKETPEYVFQHLKKYIRHTHIKDAKIVDGKVQYTLLGKGEAPIFEAIDILAKDGYKGYYSFEWEKMWHPEIDEPEIAFADYAQAMKQHFNKNR
ncbi:MAG TPA: sugar phosphate isomerase/epimerase family protein [Chitinophagaceae bacterium]|jgi:sugar phosphate isomerase/epimerase|nr:sugar phosphate isomerase/epimerase family protein [Chitinophagaceae bacterium]